MKKEIIKISIILFLCLFVWFLVFVYGIDGKGKVYYLNIGQGDSALVETPDKVQVLIDGGPDNSLLSELSKAMPFYDKSIDLMVMSHPQKDHIYGFIEVLKRYKVDNILLSSIAYKSGIYNEIKELLKEKNINVIEAEIGERVYLGKYSYFDVLYPFEDMSGKDVGNPNDVSVALRLSMLGKNFFFAGDAEFKEELEITSLNTDLGVDVFKADHHGSRTSNSDSLLEKLNPKAVVISVGKNNSYGHPSPSVMERFKEKGLEVFRTDQQGTVKVITDGNTLNFQTEF